MLSAGEKVINHNGAPKYEIKDHIGDTYIDQKHSWLMAGHISTTKLFMISVSNCTLWPNIQRGQ